MMPRLPRVLESIVWLKLQNQMMEKNRVLFLVIGDLDLQKMVELM